MTVVWKLFTAAAATAALLVALGVVAVLVTPVH
jgi:hypothetical protein